VSNNKIKIAVSSCLLGEAVRYDGTDKHIKIITRELAAKYNLISICPEMAVGMGVPRLPIHLVDEGDHIQVRGIDNPDNNMTKPLSDFAVNIIEKHPDICGYIFKKDSPSCGIKNVKVMSENGEYERRGRGIYAAVTMQALPLLPVIDEEDFLNKKLRKGFLLDVIEYSKKVVQ